MIVYHVQPMFQKDFAPVWFRTRDAAHAYARAARRQDPIVTKVDIPTDHEAVVEILNGRVNERFGARLAAWCLTAQGGLRAYSLEEV